MNLNYTLDVNDLNMNGLGAIHFYSTNGNNPEDFTGRPNSEYIIHKISSHLNTPHKKMFLTKTIQL
jgi:hypothetical protein